jgi:hypothetical protein
MTPEEIIEFISTNSSGEISEPIIIKSQNYELNCKWKRNIKITIRPKGSLITETGYSEIRKLPLISLILRAPQYELRGEKTELTENLLSNQYTRALLYYPASKISCENQQISYTAQLRKKNSPDLEKIINYFEALVSTLKQ